MMDALLERGRALAVARARGARDELAARIVVPGVDVTVAEEGVVLSGRGLRLRALAEPGLRWIGSVLR